MMIKNINKRFILTTILACCLTLGLACAALAADKGKEANPNYAPVNIKNYTSYYATGTVSYGATTFCKNDNFTINPGAKWQHSRGACLIYDIHATLKADGKEKRCEGYSSLGTGKSEFKITGNIDKCKVEWVN